MDTGVIYARFSLQSQNEQSIEAQIRICSEFAENKGIKIVNTYSDKAKCGTNDHRPAFQKMVSDAQTGAFRYIIVYYCHWLFITMPSDFVLFCCNCQVAIILYKIGVFF